MRWRCRLTNSVYAGVLARRGGDERLACIDLAEALIAKYAQMETKASVDGVEFGRVGEPSGGVAHAGRPAARRDRGRGADGARSGLIQRGPSAPARL